MPKGINITVKIDGSGLINYLNKWAEKIEKEMYWLTYFRTLAEGQHYRLN